MIVLVLFYFFLARAFRGTWSCFTVVDEDVLGRPRHVADFVCWVPGAPLCTCNNARTATQLKMFVWNTCSILVICELFFLIYELRFEVYKLFYYVIFEVYVVLYISYFIMLFFKYMLFY